MSCSNSKRCARASSEFGRHRARKNGRSVITTKWQPAFDTMAAALVTLLYGLSLIVWLDSVNIETTNGLWKSLQVEGWKADPDGSALDRSNYLYFPTMALLGRLLDFLGVYPDKTFKQLAVINAVAASIAVAIVHRLVWRLTSRRDLAAIAGLFQFGCGFFLVLSVGNEDIMPSFTPVLAAMAMAALWFEAPTIRQVIATAAMFTEGWLGDWRLMIPALA